MLKRDVTLKVQCTAEQAVAALEASRAKVVSVHRAPWWRFWQECRALVIGEGLTGLRVRCMRKHVRPSTLLNGIQCSDAMKQVDYLLGLLTDRSMDTGRVSMFHPPITR